MSSSERAVEKLLPAALFDLAPSAMVICDQQGLVQRCNRAFSRLIGWPEGAPPPGRKFKDLLTRPAGYVFGALVLPPLLLRGAVEEVELDIVALDGSSLPVLLGGLQLDAEDGESLHYFSLTTIKGRRVYAREQLEAKAQLARKQDYLDLAEKLSKVGHWHAELATGKILWSPEVYAIHGRDPKASASPSLAQAIGFYHEDDRDAVQAIIAEAVDTRQPFAFEKRLVPNQTNDVRVVETYGQCEFDAAGEVLGIFGVIRDVTDSKRAEEALRASEETFRIAMEHASIGMAVLDPTGRWLRVNQALADFLGYSQDELLNHGFRAVTHRDDVQASDQLIRQLLDGEVETYTVEKRYMRRSGDAVWAELNASAVRNTDGSAKYLVAHIQDITERREMERLKNELISTVSHELRTPVTAIRGALGLLVGTMANDLPDKVNKLIEIANKNSERLILLVNDMLDIDKIASGKMQFDMRHEWLGPLILSAIETNQPYAERFGVIFETNAAMVVAQVAVDPARLQQVMSNLLSNAAKFSPTDGQVDVDLSIGGKTCRISVRDHGQGISAAFAPLIFGKFSQADSSATRAKYGSGLGLHISKELIEHMGGAIGFDSEPGKGSTFWVDLPMLNAPDVGSGAD